MASNFNNYIDKKPIQMNPGYPQANIQTNPNLQNQNRQMSGNACCPNAPWATSTPQWQNSHPQLVPNNSHPGYVGQQMKPQIASPNQQWQNVHRGTNPQNIQPMRMVQQSSSRPPQPWPSSPPNAMPQHLNPQMTASPGSPSRTAPPSWPSSSPRATSTFMVQPHLNQTNNTPRLAGQQVSAFYLLHSNIVQTKI